MDFYSGDDATAMEFLLLGGRGVISVAANVVPKLFHDLCSAALAKNHQRAEKINASLIDLYAVLFVESNPIPTKWILQKMGLIHSGIRLPLTQLSSQHHKMIESALHQLKLV